jgi:BMFP domain-containing protein YqiC
MLLVRGRRAGVEFLVHTRQAGVEFFWSTLGKPVWSQRDRMELPMTQTSNRFFDELGKLMTDAAGAAQGAQKEMESFMRAQGEKMLAGMDLVRRDEFEAVKAMAAKAREDSEALLARVASLESEISRLKGGA